MAYKQQGGRPQMAKTGRGIPKELMGPEMAQDGPIDDFIENVKSGVKNVGQRLSNAYDRAGYEYEKSIRPSNSWGSSRRGGTYAHNPVSAVTGFVKGLVENKAKPDGAKMYKK